MANEPDGVSDNSDSSLFPRPGSERDAKAAVVVMAGVAAALAPFIAPFGSTAVGSAAMQLIDWSAKGFVERAAARAAATATEALAQSALSEEEFSRRIVGDAHTENLALQVFGLAATATTAGQLRLYAKILANGVDDVAQVDDELLLAVSLGPLERPHFRVLAELSQQPPSDVVPDIYWTGKALQRTLGWQQSSIISVVLTLQASGLVYLSAINAQGAAGGTWNDLETVGKPVDLQDMVIKVTSFGQLVNERAEEAAESVNLFEARSRRVY